MNGTLTGQTNRPFVEDGSAAGPLLPIPITPVAEPGWREQIEGALVATWDAGTDYGSTVASGAIDAAGRAAQGVGDAVGFAGRYGAETANSALSLVGGAVSGLSWVGGSVIEQAVVAPGSAVGRTAATVAEAAIVRPARAVSRFVLIALAIVCGSGVAIAGFAALAMYFYHGASSPVAAPATIVVLPAGTMVSGGPAQAFAPHAQPKAATAINAAAAD